VVSICRYTAAPESSALLPRSLRLCIAGKSGQQKTALDIS